VKAGGKLDLDQWNFYGSTDFIYSSRITVMNADTEWSVHKS